MKFNPFILSIICICPVWGTVFNEPLSFTASDNTGKCGQYLECPGIGGRSTCCPFAEGKCCGNRLFLPMKGFCCPKGYDCKRQGICSKSASQIRKPSSNSGDLLFSPKKVNKNVCPDGTSYCSDGETCCQMKSGQYGCCPYRQAVCCPDKAHCCPSGTYCDVSSSSCVRAVSSSNPFLSHHKPQRKLPALPVDHLKRIPQVGYVVCPDGASECSDGQTCCLLADGNYGCCPYPEAVCCEDGVHCCPKGTQCDAEAKRCLKQDSLALFLSKAQKSLKKTQQVPNALSAKVKLDAPSVETPHSSAVKYRRCGKEESICNDWETCCQYPDKSWGCCPLPEASCCPNGLSCCPHGYICDKTSSQCKPVSRAYMHRPPPFVVPVKKAPAFRIPKSVICPDGVSVCPDSYTCCVLSDATWGCCPLPQAVCCSDHIHCCPNGYSCDISSGSCDKNGPFSHRLPMSKKVTTKKAAADMPHPVFQPHPTVRPASHVTNECQARGLLTCTTDDNQNRCCPFKMGTCCSGGHMCCPLGYSCSQGSMCVRNGNL